MVKQSILIAASIYPPDAGGPALHAKKQYEYFQSQGYSVGLVALAHFRKYPKGIRHVLYFFTLFIKALRTNVIYAHDALGVGLPVVLVSFLLRKKLIVRIGGDLLWEREAERGETKLSMNEWYEAKQYSKKFSYSVISFVLRHTDRLIVPSILLSNIYEKYYAISAEAISVVPNPIPAQETLSTTQKSQSIVFASRLVAYKNLAFVLESMKKIFPQFPDVIFDIFGDGPERIYLETLSRDLGIDTHVRFHGSVSQEEVLKATSQCLFTIAPALTEFNPNYVLQGMSMGKPFLVSSENGFPFSVPLQFVFHVRNHEEFEQKLFWILSEAGYEEARALVSSIHFTQTWEENLTENVQIVR